MNWLSVLPVITVNTVASVTRINPIILQEEVQAVPVQAAAAAAAPPVVEGTEVDAPTPGNIVKLLVKQGDAVKTDQPLVIMEAMKMESEVKSPCDGKVVAVHVSAGDTVQASDQLFTIG